MKEKKYLTDKQKYTYLAIFASLVLVAVIVINVIISNSDDNDGILTAENTTVETQLTTAATAVDTLTNDESFISIETKAETENTPFTTSVFVQEDGTTVYIQTNIAPVKDRYLTKEDAEKSKPASPPVTSVITSVTAAPAVTTPATTTEQKLNSDGLPSNPVNNQVAVDANGERRSYDEITGMWTYLDRGTAPGITLSPEVEAEIAAHPEWKDNIVGH